MMVHPTLAALETTCVSCSRYCKVADRVLEHAVLSKHVCNRTDLADARNYGCTFQCSTSCGFKHVNDEEVEKHCEIRLPQRHTSSEISQILERGDMPPAQASFVRCICGVDKRQESSEDACRPCDRSAAASASSRRAGRHETSIDEGGEQAHRSLKQRGSPPLESRGSKHPPQTRRPQPLRPPSRRAGPRAVAAPSPSFSSRKVSQITHFNLGTCIRRPDRCCGALAGLCYCQ